MATTNSSNACSHRWTRTLIGATAIVLAGCVSMTEPECRSADWYQLGWQDALGGLQPVIEVYAHQCEAFKVKANEAQYMKGWSEGKWEYDGRVHRSDCCPI
jgi:hypothetical protein